MATRKTGGAAARLGGARKRAAGGSDRASTKAQLGNPVLRMANGMVGAGPVIRAGGDGRAKATRKVKYPGAFKGFQGPRAQGGVNRRMGPLGKRRGR